MEKKTLCPQCGSQLATGAKQCRHCGCWLVLATADAALQAQLEEEQALKEEMQQGTRRSISGARVGNFLEEDIKNYWNGYWGDRMPARFKREAAGKKNFVATGFLFPGVWLALRREWAGAAVVTLINYGLPTAVTLFVHLYLDPASKVAQFANNAAAVMSLALAVFFAFWLTGYLWKRTQAVLISLGCENREPYLNSLLDEKIRQAGRPSLVGAGVAFLLTVLLIALISAPMAPAII